MRIGLLTFHRALNYGAVLQCYALQQELSRRGHEVSVIDYRQPVVEDAYRPIIMSWLLKKMLLPWRLVPYLRRAAEIRRGHRIFDHFRRSYFNLSEVCASCDDVPGDYDAYVIGSDQLWARHITGRLDPVYLGAFSRKARSRLVGYAVSGTADTVGSLDADALKCLEGFDAFSFREPALVGALPASARKDIGIAIDPTLLAEPSVWDSMDNEDLANERYVLLYEVRRPADDKGLLARRAKALADKIGCKVLDLSPNDKDVRYFVSAFRYAECVVTSSFHATAFALIFHRPFYTYLLHDGKDLRYVDLLDSVGLQEAMVEKDFVPDKVPDYDFGPVQAALDSMRRSSLRFLLEGIEGGAGKG